MGQSYSFNFINMPESLFKLDSQKPSAFFPRLLQVGSQTPLSWPCTTCPQGTTKNTSKCEHIEICTECSNYQIEKILRCQSCCQGILGQFPSCGSKCSRATVTQKSTARCDTCGLALRKRCVSCKKDPAYVAAKQQLKSQVKVYVTAVSSLKAVDIRPCSHCRVCVSCKNSLTKGHRERGICNSCKSKNNSANSSPVLTPVLSPVSSPVESPESSPLQLTSSPVPLNKEELIPTPPPIAAPREKTTSILRDSSSEVNNSSFLVKRKLPTFQALTEGIPDMELPMPKQSRFGAHHKEVHSMLHRPWNPLENNSLISLRMATIL